MPNDIVYIFDEGVYGVIVQQNAYWAVVQYAKDGIEYEVKILNDDYEVRAEGEELEPDDE